jgi:uncharacterized membrane protein YkvA (DUF1232 family)
MLAAWKAKAGQARRELRALALASRDPRVPWYAKALAGCVVAYAVSPIDLVPDVIPVLGYLDDLVLVPLGIVLVRRMIPPQVLAECRAKAGDSPAGATGWIAAGVIVALWVVCALAAAGWLWTWIRSAGSPDALGSP